MTHRSSAETQYLYKAQRSAQNRRPQGHGSVVPVGADIISVDSDEDIGEPVHKGQNSSNLDAPSRHSSTDPIDLLSPEDGPSTQRLKKLVGNQLSNSLDKRKNKANPLPETSESHSLKEDSDSNDPIESFSDDIQELPARSRIQVERNPKQPAPLKFDTAFSVNVKARAAAIDRLQEEPIRGPNKHTKATTPIPTVDFSLKNPKPRMSKKSLMKTKSGVSVAST